MNGKILQVLGPVVDVEFLAEGGSASGGEHKKAILPAIYDALEIKRKDNKLVL